MAKLYITEYAKTGFNSNGAVPVAREPMVIDQTPVAIGSSSAQSAAFQASTRLVRLHTDAVCSVVIGSTASGGPVATVNNRRMAANQTEYFEVDAGSSLQAAVITNT